MSSKVQKTFSDEVDTKSDGSQFDESPPDGDDEPVIVFPRRNARRPLLSRGGRTPLVGLNEGNEDREDDENPPDFGADDVEFQDVRLSLIGPAMDSARLFAMTMLAESDRRLSQRSLVCDDASSASSAGFSMK